MGLVEAVRVGHRGAGLGFLPHHGGKEEGLHELSTYFLRKTWLSHVSRQEDAALGAAPLLYRTAAPTSGYYSLLHNGRRLSGRGRLRHAI